MAIWNLGSISIDNFYSLSHMPSAGEVLTTTRHWQGLGGKGASMSVACARAAARVHHIGTVGKDGAWAVERLLEYGVDTRAIEFCDTPTGHANVVSDDEGYLHTVAVPGANRSVSFEQVLRALGGAAPGDWFLTQNETSLNAEAAIAAKGFGLHVAYVASPFVEDAVTDMLQHTDLMILNAVEAQQIESYLDRPLNELGLQHIVVTHGPGGVIWMDGASGSETQIPAQVVEAVHSVGAGDTFAGYLIAGIDRGLPMLQALALASRAAALMVTRHGTADVVPDLKDLQDMRFA